MQIRQRTFKCTDMQIRHFILDILHAFLSVVVAKLFALKNSQDFLAHPVVVISGEAGYTRTHKSRRFWTGFL